MTRRTVEEHAAAVAALLAPVLAPRAETVSLAGALGRLTAEPVRSPVDLPLFRNSQMDGYAVRAADLVDLPRTLPVAGVVPAGAPVPAELPAGTALRIMTGAPVPPGADAIVPVEDTAPDGHGVRILAGRRAGEYVREPGSDVRRGDVLVPSGTRLAARHLAALAASGLAEVPVRRSPRVAILTTGDEVVPPGSQPAPGQLFDANGIALDAAAREAGAIPVLRGHASDDPAQFATLLAEATERADLVLTSGGISQGDYEVVRQALEPRGAWVGAVAMQPGGPQATGVVDGVPVLCFPGNPVSTQISFTVFLRPLLRAAAGLPPMPARTARLAEDVRGVLGKRQFRRGRVGENGRVELVAGPGSHLVASMAAADVLVEVTGDLPAGAEVAVIPL
ncbi:gephyrin-like molybdotransferase Glp [Naasia sp. SYSU D00948]|uniref:molybdopterin molybdotransferase MoeA n=1 Tax=Naasia sp. SYSU D00948 TaxID=2817379 RepID=UPI001B30B226|nr:gephyrin-like molybdotransferase Glp [Naasia sp. SYSU D00948]